MPNLEHVALFVQDLERAREFYCRWFGATSNDQYHNPRTGLRTYFLSFDGGARLEIMARPDVVVPNVPNQLGWAHIAITVGTKESVDTLAARLHDAGYEIMSGPRTTGDGYYEAVVKDPEGNYVEFAAE